MRLIFGMVLGAMLTISAAYVADTTNIFMPAASARSGAPQAMVNWDVVAERFDRVKDATRHALGRLTRREASG